MTTLAGVDGCPDGWVCVAEREGSVEALVAPSFAALVDRLGDGAVAAVDVPIGLTDAGPRPCDVEARRVLGRPRGSSVFPAPVRACLGIDDYGEACDAHARADGRRMSRQAHAILRKITEADGVMTPALQARVREAHPEVCFSLWNGGCPMRRSKKTQAGRAEREVLIDAVWPGARAALRGSLTGARYGADDLYDAFAALWTARRVASGAATVLGDAGARDARGLRMEIVA